MKQFFSPRRMRARLFGAAMALALLAPPAARAALIQPDTAAMVARVMPSVVNIEIITGASPAATHTAAGRAAAQAPKRMVGSGFIIDPGGLIVTNKHVVAGARRILVTLSDHSVWRAKVIGMGATVDIALISIHADHPLQPSEIGDSSKAAIGDAVVAIGNPLGLSGSVTGGMVSALNRDIHSSPFDNFIQTDAAINHGSSGGPLLDLQGRVIGMNTALDSPTDEGGSIGIGFSMPVNDVMFVIDSIRKYGEVKAGWMGVKMQPVGNLVAKALGLPNINGAIVTEVTPNSPAATAGLRQGDVVLDFDHQPIPDVRALLRMAGESMPGTQVSLTLWRDGATTDQNLTLAQYPEELVKPAMVKPPSANPDATPDYGLKLSALSPSLRKQYKIAPAVRGVVVTAIDPDGEAADTSLAVGDVIVKAEDQDAQSARVVFTALKAAHEAGKDAGILLIKHDGEFRWLGIHLIDKR